MPLEIKCFYFNYNSILFQLFNFYSYKSTFNYNKFNLNSFAMSSGNKH